MIFFSKKKNKLTFCTAQRKDNLMDLNELIGKKSGHCNNIWTFVYTQCQRVKMPEQSVAVI